MKAAMLGAVLAASAMAAGPAASQKRSRALLLAPEPLAAGQPLGTPLAALNTRRDLDSLFQAGPIRLGERGWRFGLAADAPFQHGFLAVSRGQGSRFLPIGRPRDLVSSGQDLVFEPRAAFHVQLKPSLADPLHNSDVVITSLPGTPGGPARFKAGQLLDMLEKRASYFRQDGQDFFLAYVSDIDAATGRRAGTRSLVVFAQRRFRSRLWRLPESGLPVGAPMKVSLGRRSVVLLRRPDGLLVVYSGG